eukprot:IDg17808t1
MRGPAVSAVSVVRSSTNGSGLGLPVRNWDYRGYRAASTAMLVASQPTLSIGHCYLVWVYITTVNWGIDRKFDFAKGDAEFLSELPDHVIFNTVETCPSSP